MIDKRGELFKRTLLYRLINKERNLFGKPRGHQKMEDLFQSENVFSGLEKLYKIRQKRK